VSSGGLGWPDNGRRIILDGDIAACACNPKPRVIANRQYLSFVEVSDFTPKITGISSSNFSVVEGELFNDKYVIKDEYGVPMAGVEYALSINNGEPEYGITDAQGHTHLLTSIAEQHTVDIYLES
jgi:hypothetical protein